MASCRGFGSLTSDIELSRFSSGKHQRMTRRFWSLGKPIPSAGAKKHITWKNFWPGEKFGVCAFPPAEAIRLRGLSVDGNGILKEVDLTFMFEMYWYRRCQGPKRCLGIYNPSCKISKHYDNEEFFSVFGIVVRVYDDEYGTIFLSYFLSPLWQFSSHNLSFGLKQQRMRRSILILSRKAINAALFCP